MVVTLGQQYKVGEKPTVTLYTYINRHAGTLRIMDTAVDHEGIARGIDSSFNLELATSDTPPV